MLAPSMTLSEIRNEIMKDLPLVKGKADHLCKRLHREVLVKHKEKLVTNYDYVSKNNNKWTFNFKVTKKLRSIIYIVYYQDTTGLVAISPIMENDYLIFHTSLFFRQLNERLEWNLTQPKDIISAYLKIVDTYHIGDTDYTAPGVCNIIVAATQGFFFGKCDEIHRFLEFDEFLLEDMLEEAWQVHDGTKLQRLLKEYKEKERGWNFND